MVDEDQLSFSFLRDPGAEADPVIDEQSSDLVGWTSFVPLSEEIETSPKGNLERVSLTLLKGTTRKFIRVGASLTE